MKKSLILIAAAASILTACNGGYKKTESGISYKVLSHEDDARAVSAGEKEMLLMNFRMSVASTDSVIFETFSTNVPRHIPTDEPALKEVFATLSKGDSVEVLVNADTIYQKSFGTPRPESIKEGDNIKMVLKVVDVFNQAEMEKKKAEQMSTLKQKDAEMLDMYLKSQKDLKETASGIKYIVEKSTKGKQVTKGSTATVKYKGYFMNGEVFDQNMEGGEPFDVNVGVSPVIPGWTEGLQLMKEGERFKFIIPWNLAYGDRGMGPILPYTSLVFDVEVVKVK